MVISGAWLLRDRLFWSVKPGVERVREVLTPDASGRPSAEALRRARDKIDSLHGWSLDSIGVTRSELAALVQAGLPDGIASRLDSLQVVAGATRLAVRGKLDLARVPASALGPLSGALDPAEWATLAGQVKMAGRGKLSWRVETLTLREVRFPVETSQRLVEAALPDANQGEIALALPPGVVRLELRPEGAMIFRQEGR